MFWIAAGMTAIGLLAYLSILAVVQGETVAGDPLGVYFPVVKGLRSGSGLDAFAPLWRGVARMPGHPLILWAASFLSSDLQGAGAIVGIGCGAIVLLCEALILRRMNAGIVETCAALLLTGAHPLFASATADALPDMPACAAVLASSVLLLDHGSDRRRALLAGLFAGVATLVRLNLIALALAGPLILRRERRSTLLFVAGFVLGLSPLVPITAHLHARGIEVPAFYVDREILGLTGPKEPPLTTLLHTLARGLGSLVTNVLDASGWPLAALGSVAIAAGAINDRPGARTAAVLLVALIAALVPIHFEARYYLWCVPAFAAGAIIAVRAVLERIGLKRSLALGLIATIALLVTAELLARDRSESYAKHEVRAEERTLCAAIIARLPPDTTAIAGTTKGAYRWSLLRDCPSPHVGPPAFELVEAEADDAGLSFWIAPQSEPAPKGATEIARGKNQVAYVLTATIASATSTSARELLTDPWTVELPRRPDRASSARAFGLAPGHPTIVVKMESTPPFAARLTLNGRNLWCAGGSCTRIARISVGEDRALQAELLPQESLLGRGEIRVRSIRVDSSP
jgi:hypothetical protein